MSNRILGLHHITAIAGKAQTNHDFYTKTLGLRLVKKTVNFDDPGTYHFYYGNESGAAGTILTFFPWEHAKGGTPGAGMATEINYAVPAGSLDEWTKRLKAAAVIVNPVSERFGEEMLAFSDPDGLNINLVVPSNTDERVQWTNEYVDNSIATRGFHSVLLNVADRKPTEAVLTDILGYELVKQEDNRFRYATDAVDTAKFVDLVEVPGAPRGHQGKGINHHVAFRVKDEDTLMGFHEKVLSKGLHITDKIDRNYFFSLYFREPGGILFEIATDNPGFAVDEAVLELGTHLKLPPQYETHRKEIEKILPPIV